MNNIVETVKKYFGHIVAFGAGVCGGFGLAKLIDKKKAKKEADKKAKKRIRDMEEDEEEDEDEDDEDEDEDEDGEDDGHSEPASEPEPEPEPQSEVMTKRPIETIDPSIYARGAYYKQNFGAFNADPMANVKERMGDSDDDDDDEDDSESYGVMDEATGDFDIIDDIEETPEEIRDWDEAADDDRLIYPITEESFLNDNIFWEKIEYRFYDGDEIFCDDRNVPIVDGFEDWLSEDVKNEFKRHQKIDVLCVRNASKTTDYMICRVKGCRVIQEGGLDV